MHPILSRPARLAAYLLAWLPLSAMLAYLASASGGFPLTSVAAVVGPACLVLAFVCLSTWFSCRLMPLERSSMAWIVLVHALASGVAGLLWGFGAANLGLPVLANLGWSTAEQQRFQAQAAPLLSAAAVLLYLLSVALHYALLSVLERRQAEDREREARVLAGEAELRALKAQINPHFLYNSLNSISALTSVDPAAAREMCVQLADFMRRTVGLGDRHAIPLQDELSLARAFLAVERVRFGARLQVEEDCDHGAEVCLVPPLLLQPLVENAIKHGIANLPEGGQVRLQTRCSEGRVILAVENTFDPEYVPKRRTGVGLANVRKRLEARYGERANLQIQTEQNRYRVRVSLPAEQADRPAGGTRCEP